MLHDVCCMMYVDSVVIRGSSELWIGWISHGAIIVMDRMMMSY